MYFLRHRITLLEIIGWCCSGSVVVISCDKHMNAINKLCAKNVDFI
jgi:hypothetical protein